MVRAQHLRVNSTFCYIDVNLFYSHRLKWFVPTSVSGARQVYCIKQRFEDSWLSLPLLFLTAKYYFLQTNFPLFLQSYLTDRPWVTLFLKLLWDHTLGGFLPISWTVPIHFFCEFLFCCSLKCQCFWVSVDLFFSLGSHFLSFALHP